MVGSLCVSQCQGCGDICEAFPISTFTSLQIYDNKNCTIISGDFYVHNLDTTVTLKALTTVFASLQVVRGSIYIVNNPFLSSANFFKSLVEVDNIYITNNPSLIDTGLLLLQTVHGVVSVTGCDRLCPALHPKVPYRLPTNTTGCSRPAVVLACHIDGPATSADFSSITRLIAAITQSISIEVV